MDKTKPKDLVEKSHFLEISSRISYEFYSKLLKDYHASYFFESHHAIQGLVKKQSEMLYTILNDIKHNNIESALRVLDEIAKKHLLMGINHGAVFESIDIYTNLLRQFKEELGLEEFTILSVKELLEQTTAKEYIIGIIDSVFDFISVGRMLRFYSAYDQFFEEGLTRKLRNLIDVFENICAYCRVDSNGDFQCHTDKSIETHIDCMIGKLLQGIGFDIMTFGNEALKTETMAVHKVVHDYMDQLIRYYQSKQYYKAVSTATALVNSLYRMIYNYQLASRYWEDNKERLLSEVLKSKKHSHKVFLMTVSSSKEITKNYEFIMASLRDILMKYSADFDFLYFTESENVVYAFTNNDELYLYREKYENLLKDIEALSEKLSVEVLDLERKKIFHIYKFEAEDLFELTQEEIAEIIDILKEEARASSREEGSPLVVVNVSERKYEVLLRVKEEISIKRAVLEKVASKDIDLFIQWIYDANLNKRFFEILARIKRGNEYVPAYKFINILQREHKMTELDIAVMTNIIKNIDKIKAMTDEFYMNIYPPSLSNEAAIKLLKELIALCNEKGIKLNLELTEYAITTQKEVIQELSKNKFYLAFDDFGAGYTNYELVGELVDIGIAKTLKVDGYIVKRMLESSVYVSIVKSISMFAKSIGLRLIYEFVDSENIMKTLKDIANDFAIPPDKVFSQGFYLHKPKSLEEEYKALEAAG